jgi:hypothetical protein
MDVSPKRWYLPTRCNDPEDQRSKLETCFGLEVSALFKHYNMEQMHTLQSLKYRIKNHVRNKTIHAEIDRIFLYLKFSFAKEYQQAFV